MAESTFSPNKAKPPIGRHSEHLKNGKALTGAHRTTFDRTAAGGAYYIRTTAWRGAGAPVVGSYKALSRVEAEALEAKDAAPRARRYAEAHAGKADTETIGGILEAFEQSADFRKGLSDSTRIVWKSTMKTMRASKLAKISTSSLRAESATRALTRWRDQEAKARGDRAGDIRLQILKRSFNWAREQGLISVNPALGIKSVWRSDRSDLIWEAEHIEAYLAEIKKRREAVKPGPNKARALHSLQVAEDALMVALFTGLRQTDVVKLRRAEIRDGAIVLAPRKPASRARTAGKKPRVVVIPIMPEIAPLLARRLTDKADFVFMTPPTKKAPGRDYTANAISHLVSDIASAAKIDRHFHDARGSFVTYARARGLLTREEVADMLGWSEADVRDIERRYLSNDAVVSATLERLRRAQAGD